MELEGNSSALIGWWGRVVSRRWTWIIAAWIVVAVGLRLTAPRWDDVTYDGDLAYMPSSMVSVRAEKLLESAFPHGRAKSEMVVVAERPDSVLTSADLAVIDRIAARLLNSLGVARWRRGEAEWRRAAELRRVGAAGEADEAYQRADDLQDAAIAAWDEAVTLDWEEIHGCSITTN